MSVLKNRVTYSKKPNHAARSAHAKGARQFQTYDTSYIRPKKSKLGTVVAVLLTLVLLGALGFGIMKLMEACSAQQGSLLGPDETATIVVSEGESAKDVGNSLVEARLVHKASDFTKCVKQRNAADKLKAGTYTIAGGQSVDDILNIFIAGTAGEGFTVVEGATLEQIAAQVEEFSKGSISADDFMAAASDAGVYADSYPFLEGVGNNSLEGFLFPKTYELHDGDTAESVVRMMLDQFASEIDGLDWSYPESQGMDTYAAVKLASIVEKESSGDEGIRARVAAVFYNRLATEGAPSYGYLNSDATTAYEVKHDPTAEEVHAESPYSTYTNTGLPPTPICSPGLDCLTAVCAPDAESLGRDYFFYFEEAEDGTVEYYFSESYDEHMETFS